MTNTMELPYQSGDIVWVKTGRIWWPGKVVDFESIPEEDRRTFRTKPLVTVKFFKENKYQYVRNVNHISFYNCAKKDLFIKQGLSLNRKQYSSIIDKFPNDIYTAERETEGDIYILSNPKFSKISASARDLYRNLGLEVASKIPATRFEKFCCRKKSSTIFTASCSRCAPKKKIAKATTPVAFTHSSCAGNKDNLQIHIRIQSNNHVKETAMFFCLNCVFRTPSLEGMLAHLKTHKQIPRTRTSTIEEDIERAMKGLPIALSEDEEDEAAVDDDECIVFEEVLDVNKNNEVIEVNRDQRVVVDQNDNEVEEYIDCTDNLNY